MGRKSDINTSTITIFDLLNFMLRHSSAEHKLSISEIAVGMTEIANYKEDYGIDYLMDVDMEEVDMTVKSSATYGTELVDASVKRQVSRLIEKYLDQELIYGITICCDRSVNDPDSFSQIYYTSHILDDMEVNLLRDAVSIYSYAEVKQTAQIIDKLNSITPVYNREDYDPELVSAIKYPGTYFNNLHEITKAFSRIKASENPTALTKEQRTMKREEYDKVQSKKISKIRFVYCEYDENKELKVRVKRNGETERIVNPVKLMWTNGYYYLVTLDERSGNYINYRVDRMKEVKCLNEDAITDESFSADKYKYSNPVMYFRKHDHNSIVIKCKKSVINNAIDTFGFDIKITPSEKSGEVIIELFNVSTIGVKMWALEYGYGAEIISPPELREEMKTASEHLYKLYCN